MGYELEYEDWLERERNKTEAGGKHLIDSDVELDEAAMLDALKDSKDWQQQLDADTENLITDWTDYKEQDECYGE